ncbi:hypothetical protein O3M35_012031 [Rhynocoris fuscipes]|uniref:Uncharacterized protein n=1 Tax=Rhynocoris fuscipes TaxID=488301 RepID=A0AAW1CTG4_9HEMI
MRISSRLTVIATWRTYSTPLYGTSMNDDNQAVAIAAEKANIYEKCAGYLQEKFRDKFGESRYEVRGLWFGSRGTIPQATFEFLIGLGADASRLALLAEEILIDSLGILGHHIYS